MPKRWLFYLTFQPPLKTYVIYLLQQQASAGWSFQSKIAGESGQQSQLMDVKTGTTVVSNSEKDHEKRPKRSNTAVLLKPNLSPASTISCKFTVKMWPMCDKLYTEYQPLNHLYLISILLLVISVLCMDVDKENLQIVSGSADNKLCVSSITPEVCSYREPYLVM